MFQVTECCSPKKMKTETAETECQVANSNSIFDTPSEESIPSSLCYDYISPNTLLNFHLRPRRGVDRFVGIFYRNLIF